MANKDDFDEYQAFRGKITRLNMWNFVLNAAQVLDLSNCFNEIQGNIVRWEQSLFAVRQDLVEQLDPNALCTTEDIWLYFPGKRTHRQASVLCAAHEGWIVTPKSEKENEKAVAMYGRHADECTMEGEKAIGWIGVRTYNWAHFTDQASRVDLNFSNFYRYTAFIAIDNFKQVFLGTIGDQ